MLYLKLYLNVGQNFITDIELIAIVNSPGLPKTDHTT